MPSIAMTLRRDKPKADQTFPIYFRITKNRKSSYISSGQYVAEKYWDDDRSRVKSTYPKSTWLNNFLTNKLTQLENEFLKAETKANPLTTKALKEKIIGKEPTDFFSFADEVTATYKTAGNIGTHDTFHAIISKLKGYMNGSSLTFEEITPQFLLKYEKYLREKHENGTNTVYRDMKYIKKIFKDGYKQDIIDTSVNPFLKCKFKTEKTTKIYLSEEQVKTIEELKLERFSRMDLHRDMFIFSCYVGLRVSDVLVLRWPNFDGTNINITIRKTNDQFSIRVPQKGVEILRKYDQIKQGPNDLIFPMMNEAAAFENEVSLDAAISSATAYINKNLKSIAENCGIEGNLSFHVARHTFATRALKMGIPVEIVQRLLSHSDIRTTMIYAKVVSGEMDKAMEKFNK